MASNLITVTKGDSEYRVVQQDDRLYRKEEGQIAEWVFYGGARAGVDFDVFVKESCPQSPLARDIGHEILGLGRFVGLPLKETAQPLTVGHAIIVSPIRSPRAEKLGIPVGKTAYLSGIVKNIEPIVRLDDVDAIAKLL